MSNARVDHYADFYADAPGGYRTAAHDPPAPSGVSATSRPTVVVLGNCQAESLRIMLHAGDLVTVRIPPVHELVASDMPALARVLGRTDILISQPIRDDYRGLPIGTAQVGRLMPAGGSTVLVPVVRFAGLYPDHVIIRPPSDPALSPPIVAYHNLRVLAEAGGLHSDTGVTSVTQVEAIAAASIEQLHAREIAHGTVVISDLFESPDFSFMRTVNHPGNPVFALLAARVRARLGSAPFVVEPERQLLASVYAPRMQSVIDAFGLDAAATDEWLVDGHPVNDVDVHAAHRAWYDEHPDAVAAGITRHAQALQTLGFS